MAIFCAPAVLAAVVFAYKVAPAPPPRRMLAMSAALVSFGVLYVVGGAMSAGLISAGVSSANSSNAATNSASPKIRALHAW